MHTASLDDKGTVFYYEDSGAPSGSPNYTTLVLVHGTCFHSGTFAASTFDLEFREFI